jgi:hypothetical protein
MKRLSALLFGLLVMALSGRVFAQGSAYNSTTNGTLIAGGGWQLMAQGVLSDQDNPGGQGFANFQSCTDLASQLTNAGATRSGSCGTYLDTADTNGADLCVANTPGYQYFVVEVNATLVVGGTDLSSTFVEGDYVEADNDYTAKLTPTPSGITATAQQLYAAGNYPVVCLRGVPQPGNTSGHSLLVRIYGAIGPPTGMVSIGAVPDTNAPPGNPVLVGANGNVKGPPTWLPLNVDTNGNINANIVNGGTHYANGVTSTVAVTNSAGGTTVCAARTTGRACLVENSGPNRIWCSSGTPTVGGDMPLEAGSGAAGGFITWTGPGVFKCIAETAAQVSGASATHIMESY